MAAGPEVAAAPKNIAPASAPTPIAPITARRPGRPEGNMARVIEWP